MPGSVPWILNMAIAAMINMMLIAKTVSIMLNPAVFRRRGSLIAYLAEIQRVVGSLAFVVWMSPRPCKLSLHCAPGTPLQPGKQAAEVLLFSLSITARSLAWAIDGGNGLVVPKPLALLGFPG